jgi:hypothetical protein
VVEDLLLQCKARDPVLVFDVLLLLLRLLDRLLFVLLRVQSQFLYRLRHRRYNHPYQGST